MTNEYPQTGATLARQDYEWLLTENEDLVRSIEADIAAGADPEGIGRFIAREIGEHRVGTIRRCVNAARHIERRQRQRA